MAAYCVYCGVLSQLPPRLLKDAHSPGDPGRRKREGKLLHAARSPAQLSQVRKLGQAGQIVGGAREVNPQSIVGRVSEERVIFIRLHVLDFDRLLA
jgi:hypothetical protein